MHPVIAHFLDPNAVRAALEKASAGKPLTEVEELFVHAANAHPDRKQRALRASGGGDNDDQQAALALAVFAALAQVERDPSLGSTIGEARRALQGVGASEEEIQQFLSLVLLEEAFGFDDDADTFDRDLVAETFRTLPRLAALDEDRVSALEESFVSAAPPDQRPLLLATAQALFAACWSDGPVPVSPEHLEAALEQLRSQTSDTEFATAAAALQSLLQLLAREGLIGLQRLQRLLDTARRVATALTQAAGEGDDDEDFDEEDDFDDDDATDDEGVDEAPSTDPDAPQAPDDDLTDPIAQPLKPGSGGGSGTRN